MKHKDDDLSKLRKQVNILDEKYRVKLSDPDFFKQPEENFYLAAFTFQEYLGKLICKINHVETSIDPKSEGFDRMVIRLSKLRWSSTTQYDLDSLIYKSRFLTLFLTEILSNVVTLCEKEFKYHSPGIGIYEHQYFYLKDMMDKVSRFITLFLNDEPCENLMVKMLEYCYFLRVNRKKKAERLIVGSKQYIRELREGCRSSFLVPRLLDDALILDMIFKFTILTVCSTGEEAALPAFESYKNKKIGVDDFRYEIAYIGKSIICSCDDFWDMGLMYQFFKGASPKLEYTFPNIRTNEYLKMGANALDFTKFILNTKDTDEIIDTILDRNCGGWFS